MDLGIFEGSSKESDELGLSSEPLMAFQRSSELPRWMLLRVRSLTHCWICAPVVDDLLVTTFREESQSWTKA